MVATCAPGIPLALRHAVFGIGRIARRTAGLRAAAMAKGGLHRQAARLAGRSGPRARPADRRHSLVWHKATRSSAVGPQPRPAHPVGQRGDRLGDQRRGVRAHVTGASSGIGAATARLLHKAGAHPVLAARRADRLAVLSEELDGALAVPTDVTDPTAVRRLVETTLDRHGRIDGLVNNAGVSLHSPLDRLDLDEFARVLQLNVISLVAMTQAVLPAMRARGSGRIVNMLTAVARRELEADGIAVSLVLPSITATEFGGGRYQPGEQPRPGVVAHSAEYVGKVVLRALRTGEERIDIPHGPEQPELTEIPDSP